MIGLSLRPTREDVRAMLNQAHPVLLGFLAFLVTVVIVSAIGGIVYLAAHDKGTEAIGALLLGLLAAVYAQVRNVARQTNGTQSKLVDAVIASPPVSNVDTSTVDGAETVVPQGNAAVRPHRTSPL